MTTAPRSQELWQITVCVSEPHCDATESILEAQLGEAVLSASRFEAEDPEYWQVQVILEQRPDIEPLAAALSQATGTAPSLAVEPVLDTDWVTAALDQQPPVRVGRYFVHGSHITDARPPGSLALRIDAGQAFGTGSHESTHGCLIALDQIARRRATRNALDLGCGAGVLALAIAKTFRNRVLASDIDPVAVAIARRNALENGLATYVDVVCADGLGGRDLERRAPFDLVMANILAGPLVRMAAQMRPRVSRGGLVVLSGLLASQEAMVLSAYRYQGFAFRRRIGLKGWPTLVLARR